jgi:hypothetical protein
MTDSITPPPELVQQWVAEIWHEGTPVRVALSDEHIATRAAQWGADQELEACLRLVEIDAGEDAYDFARYIRATRRPKPPSLKEQALGALSRADKDALTNPLTGEVVALRTILNKEQSDTIRRALEADND